MRKKTKKATKGKRGVDTPNARARDAAVDRWAIFLDALRDLPVVKHACIKAELSRSGAYKHRNGDRRFAEAWDQAIEEGVDAIEIVAHELAMGRYKPTDEECEPPSADLIKFILRSRRVKVYGLAIKVTGAHTLADLRSMTDEQLEELAVATGLKPGQ